ncbi:hypothetical protein BC936DRAFT_145655 [Jimgerdemannia flammicorona]|uniref:DUSP domain-containing protein n=1 Tax=Jimgerdemannia flammicorona TaxID=994334 RepID=A0A433D9J6_9FUNG|nr:hypothetical protein BC936DRAFT_145655 [Jimgerdemannia flammicorona]
MLTQKRKRDLVKMDHNQTSLENTTIDSTDDTLCTKRPFPNNHDEPDVVMIDNDNDNNDNDGSRINHTNHNSPDGLVGGNALSSSQLSYTTSSSKDTHTLSQETLRLSQDGIYDAQTVDPNPAATTSSTSAVHHATDAGDEVLEKTLDSYSSSPSPPLSTHTSNDASSPPPMLEPREQSAFIHSLRYGEMVEGETWYLIESRWWHRWQTYCIRISSDNKNTKELGVSTSPGPIINEDLFADKERTKLKMGLSIDGSVFIVPQRAWDALTAW